jgi:hypothetical protein
MSISYKKIKEMPSICVRLFGLSVEELEVIIQKVEPHWIQGIKETYKRPGRNFKLSLADMVLMLLLYYRSYVTQLFIGCLFGIDDSRVCRIIRKLEPILAKVMAIKKERHLKPQEIESIIIDATEQPCERPKRKQTKYYSGKKKRHTLKTEIRVTKEGRIVHVSKTKPGSVHDFALYKSQKPLYHKDARAYVDSGYQGLDKLHKNTEYPYKKSKHHPLTHEEKEYNQGLSRVRVIVEQTFAKLKTFKILSYPYRNKRKKYNIKFNIIAGIINLKNGFMASPEA